MLDFTQIRRNCILFCLLFLTVTLKSNAQTGQWYTSDGELSSSLINGVLYDSRGMLWIATEDCLNRFDGSKFTIYQNDINDPTSIGNDRVNDIFEDADGRLFVCTHAGVQLYDPATDSFSEPLRVDSQRGTSSPLSSIVQRKSGELWAVGNEVYRIVGDKDAPYLEHIDLPAEIRFIYKGIADADDNIWLSKHTEGLYRISPTGEVKHYLGKNDDPVVTSFGIDDDNNLYIGSAKHGLNRYVPATDSFEHVPLNPKSEAHTIYTIYPDRLGNLLIGTDGGGMVSYDPKTGTTTPFKIANIDYDKIKIHGLAMDTYGNLWVGVYQKGLLKLPKITAFFHSIDQRTSNLIGSCCVTAIVRDKEGVLWAGTDNDDIFAIDLDNHTSRHYTIDVPASIMGLYEDSKGRLWIGSYNRGMGIIDKYNGKYTPVKIYNNGIEVSHVYDFAELPDGDLLIATMGAGLYRYSDATKTAERIHVDGLGDWVTAVEISDDNNEIYIGTYDGFFILSPDFKTSKWLLRNHIISAIHPEPKYGDIWLGTNTGLARINEERELERLYTIADGLPSPSVYAIERGDDALWLSTNHGLSKFNVKKGTFTNFNVDHGLPNNEFSRNSSFKDPEGNIYFGGINGIATFKASDINMSGQKLTLRVTDFFIGNKSINASTKSGGHNVIDCPIADARVFRLSHNDNSFSIRVNTMEFVNTNQTEFYYSFDNDSWSRIINGNSLMGGITLTFTNVASGKHTLKIKAVNAGIESDELVISINIDTVWYATWWAKLIYFLLFIFVLYRVYLMVLRQIRDKQAEENRRHKAEILESKLQFFTNISHEIRTPLSLVIGPLQKLQDTDKDKERSRSYRVIMRNANRILRLVNELMNLRKIDNKQMKLRFTKVDLCAFVNDLYETFSAAATAKNIKFTYDHPEGEIEAWVDHTNFDKIIMNLLSNAIKFTPEQGQINMALSTGHDDTTDGPLKNYAEITVSDTGIGISEADRKNIFNRFFQGSNNSVGGTGIGLHLTNELVKLHHGTIEVAENPSGKGSKFIVRVPLGCEHLNAEEISKEDYTEPMAPLATENAIEACNIVEHADDEEKAPARAPKSNDIVYIVEDDEEIRNYLMANLSRYFHVYGFSNGKLALEALHSKPASLVITDVMMPEMDGYTLTKKIKQNITLNQIPVIILTAKTREEDNIEAMDSGAAVYISKPFNIDVVIKTAQNMVSSVARLRNAFSGNQSQEDKLETIEVSSNDDKLMDRVMKVINKNLSNSDITVEMIAREIGISRVHLHRKLKELTNQSTRDFIRNIRLQAAAKLLREKKLTVSEVADLVGFKQANNFSTVFKEMFGMSPTAYAAKYHSKDPE